MNVSSSAKLFALAVSFSTSIFAGNLDVKQKTIDFSQSEPIFLQSDKRSDDIKVHNLARFLLTGVVVHQTSRAIGHAGIWTSAIAMIAQGALFGGPGGAQVQLILGRFL